MRLSFIFILFVILGFVVLTSAADVVYDNPTLPHVPQEEVITTSGGNTSFNQTLADSLYLRLDTTNDPLTGDLQINKAVSRLWLNETASGFHRDWFIENDNGELNFVKYVFGTKFKFMSFQNDGFWHILDTAGIRMDSGATVTFRDIALSISSPVDGEMQIDSDDLIDINAGRVDVSGNLNGTSVCETGGNCIEDAIIEGDSPTLGLVNLTGLNCSGDGDCYFYIGDGDTTENLYIFADGQGTSKTLTVHYGNSTDDIATQSFGSTGYITTNNKGTYRVNQNAIADIIFSNQRSQNISFGTSSPGVVRFYELVPFNNKIPKQAEFGSDVVFQTVATQGFPPFWSVTDKWKIDADQDIFNLIDGSSETVINAYQNDTVQLHGDTIVEGNLTGTNYYAEGWGMNIGDVVIGSVDTYYNITNFTIGEMNGWTLDGENWTANVSGLYSVKGMWSFSGGVTHEYHITLAVNGEQQDKCHSSRVMGTGGDTGSAGLTCLLRFNTGDIMNVMVEDATAPATNVTIQDINVNLVRIGK